MVFWDIMYIYIVWVYRTCEPAFEICLVPSFVDVPPGSRIATVAHGVTSVTSHRPPSQYKYGLWDMGFCIRLGSHKTVRYL